MKFSISLIATALFATSALASISSSPNRLDRRGDEREQCNKDRVDRYSRSKHRPAGATATVCYTKWESYTVNRDPKHYKHAGGGSCSKREWHGMYTTNEYTCFWLIGENTFTAYGDTGYANLAILRNPDKCDYGNNVLRCYA